MGRLRPALLALALGAACTPAPPAERLLLLVTVDTLRADRLGAYGNELGLTPHLDALAAESQLFSAAYAPAPVTLPSLASLMTGRYPEQLGVLGNASQLPRGVATLAGELGRRGWRSAAVVSSAVLRPEAGLAAGFDVYDDELAEHEAVRSLPERTAPHTTRAALAALDALRAGGARSLLLWVHYQDPHGPYTPPPALRARFLPDERRAPRGSLRLPVQRGHLELGAIPAYQVIGEQREVAWYRAGYDAEVHLTDAAIGELLRGIEARGLGGRSVVAFTADHGESLGENDYWFSHDGYLSDVLVRVPLLLRVPDRPARRRAEVVALVDLLPTLLRAVGAAPGPELPGRDLLSQPAGAVDAGSAYLAQVRIPGVRRIGLVRGPYKVVAHQEARGWRARLYRRGEPGEGERELDAPPLRRELRRAMTDLRRELRPFPPERRRRLESGDREALRALGYLEPAAE